MRLADLDLKLVLAGGGALGAYQAGVYAALHEAGLAFGHLCGTSIGGVNAVLIAGGKPAGAVGRLRAFWDAVAEPPDLTPLRPDGLRRAQAHLAGVRARLFGRPALYRTKFAELLASGGGRPGLYDLDPAVATLRRLVDFDRLAPGGGPRVTLNATDVATGEAVRFDSRERGLTPEHVLASASIIPDFPPLEIDGRRLADGGFSENLPLRPAVDLPPERPTLYLAVDLIPARVEPRWTMDGMAERAQDLMFASQTRAVIDATAAGVELAAARAGGSAPPAVLARLVYHGDEPAGPQKIYDYSRRTVEERWRRGLEDAGAMLAALADAEEPPGGRLTILHFPGSDATTRAAAGAERR